MSDLIRREDVLDILDEEEWRVLAIAAVLALPAVQPNTHVNKTPKSEHDAANVLTPATKGGE